MSQPLKKFLAFADSLLPHELSYLNTRQAFEDEEKKQIYSALRHWAGTSGESLLQALSAGSQAHEEKLRQQRASSLFPAGIDRRKYAYIKSWARKRLGEIDLDRDFLWLSDTDRRIMTDAVTPDDEIRIQARLRRTPGRDYYFIRFYELVQNYQHYLLIRVRHQAYQLSANWLEQNHQRYLRCRAVQERMNLATRDIVSQYSGQSIDTLSWEPWLLDVFYDDSLDGLNRYMAVVRLSFLYYNYKMYGRLEEVFDTLEDYFSQGLFYAPRILANYYANRLLLHVRKGDLKRASYYGFLSIRFPGNDYLYYLSNLAAVLLRMQKNKESLFLLQKALPELRRSNSAHTRIGFTSHYIQALTANQKAAKATSYAIGFLQTHSGEILRHRWHLFFSSYMAALIEQEDYAAVIRSSKKYKLEEKDLQAESLPAYIPNFRWMLALARYKQLQISEQSLKDTLDSSLQPHLNDSHKLSQLMEWARRLSPHAPEAFAGIDVYFKP